MTVKEDNIEMSSGAPAPASAPEPEINLQNNDSSNGIVAYGTPMNEAEYYGQTPTMAGPPPPMTSITTTPPAVPLHMQAPEGSMCCGCFCDFRRAVIILDAVLLALSVISLIGFAAGTAVNNWDLDDDEIIGIVEDNYQIEAIIAGISVAFYIIAICGAYQFNVIMLGANIVWEIIGYILSIVFAIKAVDDIDEAYDGPEEVVPPIFSYVTGAIIVALVIYPHAGLIYEIKKGIMSHETYVREERSCCCVDRRRN